MKTKNLFLILCLIALTFDFFPLISFAQGEANWWYFGSKAGLNFNGGAPVAVTNGQLISLEGCASISDVAGNLLFYTEGMTVWNKNHLQMPNGFGLKGHFSSTQSAVIIQQPGTTLYYIFTTDQGGYSGPNQGVFYSIVDMSLLAGLGNVTTKNIFLNAPSCEKITAVRHCNNKDVWVITHDWNSDAFRAYLVTAAGVNTIPVLSNTGIIASGNVWNTVGQLKASPDGKKLASAIYHSSINRFELFDFNNSTGIVSNPIQFPQFAGSNYAYGVEFSPDGTKMYVTTYSPGNIYQFDLCAGSNTAIANSGVLIGTSIGTSTSAYIGSLQLGPDKKIYVARNQNAWLGVINSPNTLGTGCNYVGNGVSLAGKDSWFGLPNFVPWYFKQPPPFTVSDTCLTGTFTAPTINISNCSGSTNAITSVSWNFGDPASGANNTSAINDPTHIFTSAGTYTVTLVLNYACGNDTITQNVTVVNCGITATTTSANILCNGQCTGIGTANPTGGITPYTYSWTGGQTTPTATGLCFGTYTVIVTDATNTQTTATVTITQPSPITATPNPTPAPNGTAVVNPSGGTGIYTYLWNTAPPQTTQIATGLSVGVYCCTITDANNCTDIVCVTITGDSLNCSNAGELYHPNAFSPNGDGENDVLKIYYGDIRCIRTFNLVIYNRWGEKVFETNDPSADWDGSYKGKVNSAVFVCYLNATLISGEKISKKGNVSLIR